MICIVYILSSWPSVEAKLICCLFGLKLHTNTRTHQTLVQVNPHISYRYIPALPPYMHHFVYSYSGIDNVRVCV